jgi:hypothetical protein
VKRGDTVIIEGQRGELRTETVTSAGSVWYTAGGLRFYVVPLRSGSYQEENGHATMWPSESAYRRAKWVTQAQRNLAVSVNLLTFEQLKTMNAVMNLGAGEVPT